MTMGDTLNGYSIKSYLSPVSVSCTFDASSAKPLENAFALLWDQAKQLGGNGVVAIRWFFISQDSRILLSGTAVACQKNE